MSSIDPSSPRPIDAVATLAERTGFSPEAVETMRRSVARGGGRMAQFDHPEFGGMGQWMRGGMLMIGEPSNHELKRRIDALCDALSQSPGDEAGVADGGGQRWQSRTVGVAAVDRRLDQPTWYPASLGTPDTSGTQNDLRYAWFAAKRRLVVDRHGVVTSYDTGDHRIAGVSQRQGAGQTLAFSSQHGDVDLERLPVAEGHDATEQRAMEPDSQQRVDHRAAGSRAIAGSAASANASTVDPFVALEKLADLHARGIVDAVEFATKKSELLKRI